MRLTAGLEAVVGQLSLTVVVATLLGRAAAQRDWSAHETLP